MLGNLIIDKASKQLSYFLFSVELIGRHGNRILRDKFEEEMKSFLPVSNSMTDNNRNYYNKAKNPMYYGFISSEGKEMFLTRRGEILRTIIQDNGPGCDSKNRYCIAAGCGKRFIDLIIDSLVFDCFGKNNDGVPRSKSDIEAPKIVLRLIDALEGASVEEICFAMFGLDKAVLSSFDEAVERIKFNRNIEGYDYREILEKMGVSLNKVEDFKITRFFADPGVALIEEEEGGSGAKRRYYINSELTSVQKRNIRHLHPIYQPLELFVYYNSSSEVDKWLDESLLGSLVDRSHVFRYQSESSRDKLCAENSKNCYDPGLFERALLDAYKSPDERVFFIVEGTTEQAFFESLKNYADLFPRLNNPKDDLHGWSECSIVDDTLYDWIQSSLSGEGVEMKDKEIRLPQNLNIVGTVPMNSADSSKRRSLDFIFERCLLDCSNTDKAKDLNDDGVVINEEERARGGFNLLVYGVPGCGKSYLIEHDYCDGFEEINRIVFHPDYTYGDFIGRVMPTTDLSSGKIFYRFCPGPFSRILKNAYHNPKKKYGLIIEEINRGNAPAIFGDIFQLLDRDHEGNGNQDIVNQELASFVYAAEEGYEKIRMPSNLYLFATMNTADQSVFTLDTAFQRRWRMKLMENDISKCEWRDHAILDTGVTWGRFVTVINRYILGSNYGLASSEDKRLGVFFVLEEDLSCSKEVDDLNGEVAELINRRFPDKVLKYLWDDAFKYSRDSIFQPKYTSLESLIKKFATASGDDRLLIFQEKVALELKGNSQ